MKKERPILFSSDMVRALLAGRKSQTRRLIKKQPTKQGAVETFCKHGPGSVNSEDLTAADMEIDDLMDKCPYGSVGDILYVRETWRWVDGFSGAGWYEYKATDTYNDPLCKWKSPRFMRKEAARIWLEITGIRVERVQEISEGDAMAEGIERVRAPQGTMDCCWKSYEIIHEGPYKGSAHPHAAVPNNSPRTSFRELWESINGPDSWKANPFVWCITFRILSTTGKPIPSPPQS